MNRETLEMHDKSGRYFSRVQNVLFDENHGMQTEDENGPSDSSGNEGCVPSRRAPRFAIPCVRQLLT